MKYDPLTAQADPNNPWLTLAEDNHLKQEILKDIERTYQEREFFQQQYIKDQLLEIMFFWARKHPDYSYRQGMNEIGACILHTLHAEKVHNQHPIARTEALAAEYLYIYIYIS